LLEQTLCWAAVESVDEARYLTAILNSATLARAIAPLQSRGQHNPRDFASTVFSIPFPTFDSRDRVHAQVVVLAARAEQVAGAVELPAAWLFQKARRALLEALSEDGVAAQLDAVVDQLFGDATHQRRDQTASQPPGLLDLLSPAPKRTPTKAKRTPRPSAPRPSVHKRA
jgi:hypothetical protein